MSCAACDAGQPCTGPDTYTPRPRRRRCSDGACALPNPTSDYPEVGSVSTPESQAAALQAATDAAYEDGKNEGARGTLFAGALGAALGASLLWSAVRWGFVKS